MSQNQKSYKDDPALALLTEQQRKAHASFTACARNNTCQDCRSCVADLRQLADTRLQLQQVQGELDCLSAGAVADVDRMADQRDRLATELQSLRTLLQPAEGETLVQAVERLVQSRDNTDAMAAKALDRLHTAQAALQQLTGPDSATQQTVANLAATTAERDAALAQVAAQEQQYATNLHALGEAGLDAIGNGYLLCALWMIALHVVQAQISAAKAAELQAILDKPDGFYTVVSLDGGEITAVETRILTRLRTEAAQQERERLKAWIRHDESCTITQWLNDPVHDDEPAPDCNCGLAAALRTEPFKDPT